MVGKNSHWRTEKTSAREASVDAAKGLCVRAEGAKQRDHDVAIGVDRRCRQSSDRRDFAAGSRDSIA